MASRPTTAEQRCSVCNSLLRPYNAPLSKWPGTKAKVSTRPLLCSAHQAGRGKSDRDFYGREIPLATVDEMRTVRRLARMKLPDDYDFALVVDALGIGDDID